MKSIYLEFSAPFHPNMMQALKNECNIEPCYITAVKYLISEYKSLFPNAYIHDCTEAKRGIGLKAFKGNMSEFLQIYQELQHIVPTALSMLDRFDTTRDLSYYERIDYIESQFAYWFNVINTIKPDVMIFPTMPHVVYDFIAMHIGMKMNIKTIHFELANFSSHKLTIPYINNIQFKLGNTNNDILEKNLDYLKVVNQKKYQIPDIEKTFRSKNINTTSLSFWNFREVIKSILHNEKIVMNSLSKEKGVSLELSYRNSRFAALKFFLHSRARWQSGLKRKISYQKLSETVDLGKGNIYIYMPLAQQPEKTTNPLGGIFYNQLLAIKLIAENMPKNCHLYLKEHPNCFLGKIFSFSFDYQSYLISDRVKFVDMNIDNYELIDNSLCVATVNGTTSVESVCRGKKTICFGRPWYENMPGMHFVRNKSEINTALNDIIRNNKVEKVDVVSWLKDLSQFPECFIDPIDLYSDMPYEKNIIEIVKLFKRII